MRALGVAALVGVIAAGACHAPTTMDPPGSGGEGGAVTITSSTSTSTETSTSTVAYCNQGAPEACNPYGVDLDVPPLAGDAYWSVIVDALKVPFFRPGTLVLDKGADCPLCLPAVQHGRLLVLAVRANGEPGQPTMPPADLSMVRHQMGELLDAHKAAVAALAIEEGADTEATWGGTVDEYLALVATGCEAAHERKVMCVDGGISSTTMIFLLADYHASSGSVGSAIQIVTAAGDNPEVKAAFSTFPPATAEDLAAGLAIAKERIDRAKLLLPGVREAGVDAVSFHWHERDQDSLDNAMALARSLSGCNSLATTDLGQRTQDGLEAFRKGQDAAELGMRLVIWSSRAETHAEALLCDGAGTLTENGATLRDLSANAVCGD